MGRQMNYNNFCIKLNINKKEIRMWEHLESGLRTRFVIWLLNLQFNLR